MPVVGPSLMPFFTFFVVAVHEMKINDGKLMIMSIKMRERAKVLKSYAFRLYPNFRRHFASGSAERDSLEL